MHYIDYTPPRACALASVSRMFGSKGTSRFLKENIKGVKCFAADPPGASMFSYYTKVRYMSHQARSRCRLGAGMLWSAFVLLVIYMLGISVVSRMNVKV